ncbi:MAG: hypothetical protein ACR2P4_10355 [Gammaproteobacteria bacterium]
MPNSAKKFHLRYASALCALKGLPFAADSPPFALSRKLPNGKGLDSRFRGNDERGGNDGRDGNDGAFFRGNDGRGGETLRRHPRIRDATRAPSAVDCRRRSG